MKILSDLSLAGKRVLVRVDFNVPLDGSDVTDATRIRASLPTIQTILDAGGLPILLSHLGRPGGKPDSTLSLRPVAGHLETLLREQDDNAKVVFCEETVGEGAATCIADAPAGSVVLLENTRFLPGETANDPETAREMAALGDVFVSDAFGAAHRAHASTEGVAHHIAEKAAGKLLERELRIIGNALEDPSRPFVAVLGGAKVSDKIGVIKEFLTKVDQLLIGGAMAYTFLKSLGHETGTSLVEDERLEEAFRLYDSNPDKLVLPTDHVVAEKLDERAESKSSKTIPEGWMGVDIGPETRERFEEMIKKASTIVWNGPMGVFEIPAFAEGTRAIAHAIANATEENEALTIIGGGDSVAAVNDLGLADRMSHVSTGGGAMLELMEGKHLPGIEALRQPEK